MKKAFNDLKTSIINFFNNRTDLTKKIIIIIFAIILFGAVLNVAIIGFSEVQTFYLILIMTGALIVNAGLVILWYNTWCVTKHIAHGEDKKLNQAERISLQKVHAAIIIAVSILIAASTLVYYGKKADEPIIIYQEQLKNEVSE